MRRTLLATLLLLTVSVGAWLPATAQSDPSDDPAFAAEGTDAAPFDYALEEEHQTFREQLVDLTFPLPQGAGYYVDTYDAPRSGGRTHRATDIMADKMVPIHAAMGGEVCYLPGVDNDMPGYGYMIRICGDDGLRYSYIHVNNDTPGTDDGMGGPEHAYAPRLLEGGQGTEVQRGELIGWVGDSGNAEHTGSHLHFEICDADYGDCASIGRINPYRSLVDSEERGDYPSGSAPPPSSDDDDDDGDDHGDEVDEDEGDDGDDAPAPQPVDSMDFRRLAGGNRIETAVQLSRDTRVNARSVVIVPHDSHAEALVSAPLAGLIDAPILLSPPAGLPDAVVDEVARLHPLNAYVIGTTAQLSAQVEQDLRDAGVQNLARLSADDPFELSADVAAELASYPAVGGIDQVLIALGAADDPSRAWPDALSASALAAATTTPVLLVEGDGLPGDVRAVLAEFRPARITVVGGRAAISDDVAEEAAAAAGGAAMVRLSGDTRYATSAAVADAGRVAGLVGDEVWVATGRNFPDALAAGPAAAISRSPLLLIDGENPDGSPESREWLHDHAGALVVVGGTAVVSEASALGTAAR